MLSKRATVSLTPDDGGRAGEPLSSIDIAFETVCNVYILLDTPQRHDSHGILRRVARKS
jgi:hypothetical protein